MWIAASYTTCSNTQDLHELFRLVVDYLLLDGDFNLSCWLHESANGCRSTRDLSFISFNEHQELLDLPHFLQIFMD